VVRYFFAGNIVSNIFESREMQLHVSLTPPFPPNEHWR